MELTKILALENHSILSIVGAGGKTTFMYILSEELRKEHKVLITTTTKIYKPDCNQYDYINIGKSLDDFKTQTNQGIYIYGKEENEEGKLIGVEEQSLKELHPYFDHICIEADGAKGKSIKGWSQYEPVISNLTTMTIGILGLDAIGKGVNEETVHRVSEYVKLTNARENETISVEHFISIIFHQDGLFKNALGKKVLLINKYDSLDQIEVAKELVYQIIKWNKTKRLIDQIIIGSLRNKNYQTITFHQKGR